MLQSVDHVEPGSEINAYLGGQVVGTSGAKVLTGGRYLGFTPIA